MDEDRFIFYADYFTIIAESGLESANDIFSALQNTQLGDPTRFDQKEAALINQRTFTEEFRNAYKRTYLNAQSLRPMEAAFKALSEHIRIYAGTDMDGYLAARGLKVPRTFVQIANLLGESIASDKIE